MSWLQYLARTETDIRSVDFIKKGDEWKIWHFHWFRTVKASHYQGWVKDQSWLFAGPLAK